jgi:hypothetical protein
MKRSTKTTSEMGCNYHRKSGYIAKALKCQFGVQEGGFQRFIINSDGIGTKSDRISTIDALPTLETVREVQVLLGFANFYSRFIWKYAKVTASISNILNPQGSQKWE